MTKDWIMTNMRTMVQMKHTKRQSMYVHKKVQPHYSTRSWSVITQSRPPSSSSLRI